MSRALETFDEVWERLKSKDKTGTYEKAEVLALITEDALEYAYHSGFNDAIQSVVQYAEKINDSNKEAMDALSDN